MKNDRTILLSIRPVHAKKIYTGEKRAELRKSFPPQGVTLIFLYETEPVRSVTGAIFVDTARRAPVAAIRKQAASFGISPASVGKYFGDRRDGWIVKILSAVEFAKPVPFAQLQELNHYLRVPQVFAYLSPFDASTQLLLTALASTVVESRQVRLRQLRSKSRQRQFANMIFEIVGVSYSEIDQEFVEQVFDETQEDRASFSTESKRTYEIHIAGMCIGYTCLTKKYYGAVKSGPTILDSRFRGIGLGRAVRAIIRRKSIELGARKIYCTCPADRQDVLRYLTCGGLEIEARLKKHLSPSRDEYVLGEVLSAPDDTLVDRKHVRRKIAAVRNASQAGRLREQALDYFLESLKYWYFPAHTSLRDDISLGLDLGHASATTAAKPKTLLSAHSSKGEFRGTALCTEKRSNMVKINLVSDRDDYEAATRLLDGVRSHFPNARRLYCTLPSVHLNTASAVLDWGMTSEGILTAPFQAGVNHFCFGVEFGAT